MAKNMAKLVKRVGCRILKISDITDSITFYAICNGDKTKYISYQALLLIPLGKIYELINKKQLNTVVFVSNEPKVRVKPKVIKEPVVEAKTKLDEVYGKLYPID
jgi:hypothetical protein